MKGRYVFESADSYAHMCTHAVMLVDSDGHMCTQAVVLADSDDVTCTRTLWYLLTQIFLFINELLQKQK